MSDPEQPFCSDLLIQRFVEVLNSFYQCWQPFLQILLMPSGAKRICLVTKCTSDNGKPLTEVHLIFSPVSVCIVHAINIIINQCYQVFKLPKPNLEFSVVLLYLWQETQGFSVLFFLPISILFTSSSFFLLLRRNHFSKPEVQGLHLPPVLLRLAFWPPSEWTRPAWSLPRRMQNCGTG